VLSDLPRRLRQGADEDQRRSGALRPSQRGGKASTGTASTPRTGPAVTGRRQVRERLAERPNEVVSKVIT